MVFSFVTKYVLILSTLTCFFMQSISIAAVETKAYGFDFTEVAKKSIPAVVSIRVKSISKGRGLNGFGQASRDDYDAFSEEFFQRFFGLPGGVERPTIGQATGFIISPKGYILTNSHVVSQADEVAVFLTDGREFKGKIIGYDPNTDIAVVKIEADNLPYLELGNSDEVEIGQWVGAVGNLLGLQGSLTVGVISAKGRNNLDILKNEDFIQTDATINKGNSGGPLLTLDSKVVGMNTAMITSSHGYVGIGFAIPSNILKVVMNQVIQNGSVTRGFIGVSLQAIDYDLAQALGLKNNSGALVADIIEDSPADRAGLKQGDVIQSYNNIPVVNVTALRNSISLMPPKSRVVLGILRNGSSMEIPVELKEFPSDEKVAVVPNDDNHSKLGLEVQDLTKSVAEDLGLKEDVTGVVISRVEPGSVASLAGLKQGAIVVAVNKQNVSNVQEFNSKVSDTPKNLPVLLLVKQGANMRFISLRVSTE